MSEELKLCPVCGCEGELLKYGEQKWVSCNSTLCSLMLPFDEWQSRPIEDALRKQLEEARNGIQKTMDYISMDRDEGTDFFAKGIAWDILNAALAEIERGSTTAR